MNATDELELLTISRDISANLRKVQENLDAIQSLLSNRLMEYIEEIQENDQDEECEIIDDYNSWEDELPRDERKHPDADKHAFEPLIQKDDFTRDHEEIMSDD